MRPTGLDVPALLFPSWVLGDWDGGTTSSNFLGFSEQTIEELEPQETFTTTTLITAQSTDTVSEGGVLH